MSSVPTRIFITAENRLLREALSRLFENEKDIKVVGQAGHCREAAREIVSLRPDVFLLNPASPALTDLDDLQIALRKAAQVKVVLFGMEEDEKLFLEAVRQGAVGYVLKDANAPDLIASVRAVARSEAVCPPRLCRLLFNYVARRSPNLMPALRVHVQLGLTRRERELVPMIAEGLTNKEIAALLNVSEQTIKNHIHRMIQKAGASTRLDIADRYRLPELVMPPERRGTEIRKPIFPRAGKAGLSTADRIRRGAVASLELLPNLVEAMNPTRRQLDDHLAGARK